MVEGLLHVKASLGSRGAITLIFRRMESSGHEPHLPATPKRCKYRMSLHHSSHAHHGAEESKECLHAGANVPLGWILVWTIKNS